MLDKLTEMHRPNQAILDLASHRLDWDLQSHFGVENEDAFERNVDVQVGVFLANHMFLRAVEASGLQADLSLGLSLGEYNHLVHIGALGFEDALMAVHERGLAYDRGPKGWMASVQPIDLDELQPVVRSVQDLGVLEIVNLNSPRQHVLSGERAAVEAAVAILEDEHYVQPEIIERNVPMHSSLFESVGEGFREVLEGVEFGEPWLPYIPNRLGRILPDAQPEDFRALLSEHIYSPVLWRKSIDFILDAHPDAVFLEVGPRAVLHNLLQRKWTRNAKFKTDSRENTGEHLANVVAGIRGDNAPGAAFRGMACSPR
jgi:[acyl-carrier-protein] S-malonyltransferase